jgi:hypothetical protein
MYQICGKINLSVLRGVPRAGSGCWNGIFLRLYLHGSSLSFVWKCTICCQRPTRRLCAEPHAWVCRVPCCVQRCILTGVRCASGVRVKSFTPRPLFTTGKEPPAPKCIGGWVRLRAGLDTEACFCRASNPGRLVCSQMLYWLSYSSCSIVVYACKYSTSHLRIVTYSARGVYVIMP